jgi:hypothetical protein
MLGCGERRLFSQFAGVIVVFGWGQLIPSIVNTKKFLWKYPVYLCLSSRRLHLFLDLATHNRLFFLTDVRYSNHVNALVQSD